jgi:hypothetical protein
MIIRWGWLQTVQRFDIGFLGRKGSIWGGEKPVRVGQLAGISDQRSAVSSQDSVISNQ